MKKVVLFILFYFFYISLFCWSVFLISDVSADSQEVEKPILDIQPPVITHNTSDATDTEIDINPSESNIVPNDEAPTENAIHDSKSTSILNEVPSEIVFGSEEAGVTNEIINNDTPIVISRIDSATEELQKRANIPSPLSHESNKIIEPIETNFTNLDIEEDRSDIINTTNIETDVPKNLTEKKGEDIPSFSEWAQKHLEEAEKKEQVNFSSPNLMINTTKQGSGAKLRWKNYASVDCGAKVILANPEAQHTWAILVGSRDEYILNPCNSRIWLIVELCEAIQLKKIDLANYELFSSSPKDFTVSVSDRFPTRDWSIIGQFTAKDERDVQTFDVNTETFGKYVKVEIKSHYGSEHYCPLSLLRAYGMSVFEVLQKDDPAHEHAIEDEDDDVDALDSSSKDDSSGNLLSSATDAVLSMVKKVLGNKDNKTSESSQANNDTKPHSPMIISCSSPSHYVVCNNCSDTLFGKIFELLSCKQSNIRNLVAIPFISNILMKSEVCHSFGFDFRDKTVSQSMNSKCVESFFPPHFLGAMCNTLAVTYNKVLYNISYQYANITEDAPKDNLVNVETADKPKITPAAAAAGEVGSKQIGEEIANHHQPTEPLNVERPDVNSKSSCSTDITYTSQIRPSKSMTTDLPVNQELNTASMHIAQNVVEDVEPSSVEATEMNETTTEADLQTEGNGEEVMTELNTEASPSVVNTPTAASNLQGQKESVFLRLSNRIKALERNMSLSSQYLEELSKRYKKQVEEMQRVLEKTEQTLDQVKSREEDRHKQLEDRLEFLTKAMEEISAERNNWKTTSYWLFFAIGLIFIVYGINRYSTSKPTETLAANPVEIQRRNSVDMVTRPSPKKKKRRPSDQALKIVASAAAGDQEKQPKKKKKKSLNPSDSCSYENGESKFSPMCTSSKIWTKPSLQTTDWVEGRARVIEDIPFPLEESDSSTLETVPFASELSTINAPGYARTAANFRSLRNGKIKLKEESRRQSSPVSINGSISSDQTPKKERKGLKKLFKKVF